MWLLLLVFLLVRAALAAPEQVGVLIDVSGSMKKTDPDNLRAPALRLFVNLLPDRSRAGIWLFDEKVVPLVPAGVVDAAWRKRALAGSNRIHSRGRFTDIGAALEKAASGWHSVAPDQQRSLLLLTDGKVDVSKDPARNARARQRLLETTLPRLQQLGVHIHSIGLSDNADKDLLRRLATATSGSVEYAHSASELERIFLRLFQRAVDRDTVPLQGDQFTIDRSVHELTLVAFRSDPSEPALKLAPPDAAPFGQVDAPRYAHWDHETGYDLVTIESPSTGQWRLVGHQDPDNRVMIVSNLKLKTSQLPNRLIAGERVPFLAQLTEGEQTITRKDFLHLIRFSVEQQVKGDEQPIEQWQPADNGEDGDVHAGDGVYTTFLDNALEHSGAYDFVTRVDGSTFQREDRQRVQIVANPLEIDTIRGLSPGKLQLQIRLRVDWLDPESLHLQAVLTDEAGTQQPLQLVPDKDPASWRLTADKLTPGQAVTVQLQLAGQTLSGRMVNATLAPRGYVVAGLPPSSTATKPPNTTLASSKHTGKNDGIDWPLIMMLVVGFNCALAIAAAFAWLRWRRTQAKASIPSISEEIERTQTPTSLQEPEAAV